MCINEEPDSYYVHVIQKGMIMDFIVLKTRSNVAQTIPYHKPTALFFFVSKELLWSIELFMWL